MLRHGISASGPMDRRAFGACGTALGKPTGSAGIEFTRAGLEVSVDSAVTASLGGGAFQVRIDGVAASWPLVTALPVGARLEVLPGAAGNYGYIRFDREIDVPPVLGSRSTNSVVGLGGLEGRNLRSGDTLELVHCTDTAAAAAWRHSDGAPDLRFIWGIHADLFPASVRDGFVTGAFTISDRLDRMGVRLVDPAKVFAHERILSLVSDAVVAGDVQILGDGTPIVLMRDHQPTGGYPRIATIVSDDLDDFAQMRPGESARFTPVALPRMEQRGWR